MITFDPRFNAGILDGTKDTTVRLECKVYPGEIVAAIHPYGTSPFAWLRIKETWPAYKLGDVDLSREGFDHLSDLIQYLRFTYHLDRAPSEDSTFALIEFECMEAPI